MIFTTWLYGAFLVLTVLVFWAMPARGRPHFLLAAGLIFYASYYPPHVPLIVGLTILVYGCARVIALHPPLRGTILVLGVSVALGTLGYYKYTGFVLESLRSLGLSRPEWQLALPRAPLAISFFVFEYVHYLIEVRRGTIAPGRPRDFGLFILFFPTLICGPIKRFDHFQPQIGRRERVVPGEVAEALERIAYGLAKKLIVADTVGRIIAPLWAAPLLQPTWLLWLAAYGYAIQILFDFSGYSDIAIGSARLLGFQVPENFDYPYLKPNIADFWRSWHMSLTSWIRDYVYIPLGGNRQGPVRAHANRLVAMALCGLWHGAAGHFVLWGAYHGIGLNLHRLYRTVRQRLPLPADFGVAGRVVAVVFTFHFVCIGWVLFVVDAHTAQAVIWKLLWVG